MKINSNPFDQKTSLMKIIYKVSILCLSLLFIDISSYAQRKQTNDTINTDVVNVVRPYTPSVSDAFKIKEIPNLNDSVNLQKKEVKYNIFSIPVASTFTPAKGKAATVAKEAPPKTYDNFVTGGFGSYTTMLGELYLNHALSRSESVGGYLSHHSSLGQVEGAQLDSEFSNTKLNANFSSQGRSLHYNLDGGFTYDTYNWYGLPESQFDIFPPQNPDVGHSFYSAYVGGEIDFLDSFFNKGRLKFTRFGDNQGSGENHFNAQTNFEVSIGDANITTDINLDYLSGEFERNFYTDQPINYANFNIGFAPSYELKQDDLTLNLGVNFTYLNNIEDGGNKFFIYPNISASYRLVDEILIAYGGIKGELIQNTYRGLASENPFVSPTLYITPTDQQYNAYAGIKGRLSNNISYDVNLGYKADRAKALFRSNSVLGGPEEVYQYGNSFGIVYDDLETFQLGGELAVDVSRNFKLNIKGDYFLYGTDQQDEPWNLPDFQASIFMDYQIDRNWYAGAGIYFVGKRKDQYFEEGTLLPTEPMTVTLDGYFDANAHVGYRITDQLSVFAKVNNIAGKNYEKWLNYPVLGFQALGGATFQFDF